MGPAHARAGRALEFPGAMTTPPAERARPQSAREYQTLMRNRLIESRLTPNAISLTGFALCVVAAVLVTQRLFFLAGVRTGTSFVPVRYEPAPGQDL